MYYMPRASGSQRNKKTGKGQVTISVQLGINVHDKLEKIQDITKTYSRPSKAGIITELVDKEYKRLTK